MFFRLFSYCFVWTLLFNSCQTLKYQAVKTPKERERERKSAIENYLKSEFEKKAISYTSIAFGKPTIVKPASYYVLDSLYEIKYRNELRNRIDRELEKQISAQQVQVNADTTPVYVIEKHVFSLKENETYKGLCANITISKNNEVQTMEILQANIVPKNLIYYFADYCLNESFVYAGATLDESELAFYEFYSDKLTSLDGKEADAFLETMLHVMKIASDTKNLDKTNLIELMALYYAFGTSLNPVDLKFLTIEEFLTSDNQLAYYQVVFSYSVKNQFNQAIRNVINIKLDPYLSLIEKKEINPTD